MGTNRTVRADGRTGGAVLLLGPALAAVCAALGPALRFPALSRIGQEGSVWQAAPYFAYLTLWGLSAFAIPWAVARRTASLVRKGKRRSARRLFYQAFVLAAVAGALLGGGLFLGGEKLAAFFGRPMERYSWESLALAAAVLPALGTARGRVSGLGAGRTAIGLLFLEQAAGGAAAIALAASGSLDGRKSELVYGTAGYSGAFGASGSLLGLGVGAGIALAACLALLGLFGKGWERRTRNEGRETASGGAGSSGFSALPAFGGLYSGLLWLAFGGSFLLDSALYRQPAAGDGSLIAGEAGWGLLFRCLLPALCLAALFAAPGLALVSGITGRKSGRRQARERLGKAVWLSAGAGCLGAVVLALFGAFGSGLLYPGMESGMALGLSAFCGAAIPFLAAGAVCGAALIRLGKGTFAVLAAVVSLAVHGAAAALLLSPGGFGVYGLAAAHGVSAALFCLSCRGLLRLLLVP